ncbi:VOC family protein [Micromonospora endolithica]|uniref:VOC family protein n=1 Tax=Micromonospora endolithica TaxID=230091 RepID=UPI0013152514
MGTWFPKAALTNSGRSPFLAICPRGQGGENRLHLDVRVTDRSATLLERRKRVDTEVERLTGLGATVVRVLAEPGMDHYGVTMHDLEGNEFCVA